MSERGNLMSNQNFEDMYKSKTTKELTILAKE